MRQESKTQTLCDAVICEKTFLQDNDCHKRVRTS